MELSLRKEFAKDLGVGLELASGESRRRMKVSVLVRVTASSRLGVATAVTTSSRLGLRLRRVS